MRRQLAAAVLAEAPELDPDGPILGPYLDAAAVTLAALWKAAEESDVPPRT
jgi:hypothetical protein